MVLFQSCRMVIFLSMAVSGKTDTTPLVVEETDQVPAEPEDYRVYLINDDFTTMEFVISVLMSVFHKSLTEASTLTLEVHRRGRGMVGVYPYDIAVTKIDQVHMMARQRGFPLRCTMERA